MSGSWEVLPLIRVDNRFKSELLFNNNSGENKEQKTREKPDVYKRRAAADAPVGADGCKNMENTRTNVPKNTIYHTN